jgi:CHAT domain-containing protein/tetratricopeptide (TPR) repeat protein
MSLEPGTGDRSVEELLRIARNVARYARREGWPSELGAAIDQLAEQADRACHQPAASTAEQELLDVVAWLYIARFVRGGNAQDAVTAVERFAQLYGQVASRPADVFLGMAEMLMLPDPDQVPPERLGTLVTLFEAAAGFATPDSDRWAQAVWNAALLQQRLYAHTGDLNDLVRATHGFERLSEATAADENALWTAMLAWCLAEWRRQDGDLARGRRALQAWDRAYRLAPSRSPLRLQVSSDAFDEAASLWVLTRKATDRSEAVRWGDRMVRRGGHDEERLDRMEALAADAFRQGSRGAVRDAARLFRAASDGSRPGSPERARRLVNTVGARDECWKQSGRPADLDLVINEARKALHQLHDDHPPRREVAGVLAERLRQRHGLKASAGDLDEAIGLLKGLVDDAGPEVAAGLLGLIGGAVQDRLTLALTPSRRHELAQICSRAGELVADDAGRRQWRAWAGDQFLTLFLEGAGFGDLEAAIDHLDRACTGAPDDWPSMAVAANQLGFAFSARYNLLGLGAAPDLARAQHWYGVSAQSQPVHSAGRWLAQLSLAVTIQEANQYGPHVSDWPLFDRLIEQALDAEQEGMRDDPRLMVSVAQLLGLRYRRGGRRKDLDRAVELAQRAAAQGVPDAWAKPKILFMLGNLLEQRYKSGYDPRDRVAAAAAYRRAAVIGLRSDVQWAWQASREWATLAAAERDWAEAARATDHGLRAAAKIYAVQPAPSSREFWLRISRDLPGDAADIYMRAGQPAKAVTALERGRALNGSAILAATSADLDRLKRADNILYSSFLSAADAWTHAIAAERREPPSPQLGEVTFNMDYTKIDTLFVGGRMARHPVLPTPLPDVEWYFSGSHVDEIEHSEQALNRVVHEIRSMPGFGGLLRTADPADVRRAASDAPLLYLSAGPTDGVALVVRRGASVEAHRLPKLGRKAVAKRYATLQKAYDRRHADASAWPTALDQVTGWLGQRFLMPLLDKLALHERVRVVATGQLGLLPLHAAWVTDGSMKTGRRYALDQWVLSYAMNARAVSFTRRAARRPADDVLVVDDPRPAGEAALLPWSGVETAAVCASLPHSEVLSGDQATRQEVRERIAAHPVVHLSCHSRSEPARPMDSALLLADGLLRLRELLDLRLPAARLVVLSACETAVAGTDLPDEVVSLAVGLVQAGAAGVVASAWAVPGLATALLMARFYANWAAGPATPAEALREAQQWIRDTTNDEKCAYLQNGGHGRLPAEAARQLWRAYALEEPGERGSASPVEWASFALIGD